MIQKNGPGLFGDLLRIAEATDERTAKKIARKFGGGAVYIPKNPKSTTKNNLVLLIGVTKTKLLLHALGAGRLEIPQAGFRGTTARQRRARKLLGSGKTKDEIFNKTGYSRRQLQRWKK